MRHRLIALGLVVGLSALSLVAGRFALADYYYDQAKSSYDVFNVNDLRYAHDLKGIIERVGLSLSLRKYQANALDLNADLLYQSWWLSPDAQYLEDSTLLHAAINQHLKAWSIRQNWAFSAARLALIYSHKQALDEHFDHWYSLTHRLGLYETKVARSMMHLGVSNWPRLSSKQHSLTIDFIAVSIEQKSNSAANIANLLTQHGMHHRVCSSLKKTARQREVCDTSR